MSQDEYLMKYTIQNKLLNNMNLINNLTDQLPEDMPPPSFEFDSLSLDTIPESFDWRDLGYVSKPRHQLKCSSCWAFAAVNNQFKYTSI